MNKIKTILAELNPKFLELEDYIKQSIDLVNNSPSKAAENKFCASDTMLITYADQFSMEGKNNLEALNHFITEDLQNCVSIVHLLPFYPWTSDDGFAPTDYKKVCADYGDWKDVESIKTTKMFDCVFNHLSSKNHFFQEALAGDKSCEEMFHVVDEAEFNSAEFQANIHKVVRPRTSDLFTPFNFAGETKYAWTTFSADQVDTNLANPEMLKYVLETFFLYIDKGARYFRVDAVPFMWKEWGTNCSHLPKTHLLVQLFRAIIDEIKTPLYIVTESNVPHKENISYWGNGENEAHIIYNFSLAPLILHGLTFQNNSYLNSWAKEVFDIHPKTTFLNFTATHDGIGMRGLEGVVPDEEIFKLCDIALEKGGQVGKKKSRDGTVRPYELNITWASFLKDEKLEDDVCIRKIVNSHAIVMFFPGIGAHYIHNFLGTQNWTKGYEESGIARRLNRQKLELPLELDDVSTQIKNGMIQLIKFKNENDLFSANAGMNVLELHPKCLAFERFSEDKKVTVYFNLSNEELVVGDITLSAYELKFDFA